MKGLARMPHTSGSPVRTASSAVRRRLALGAGAALLTLPVLSGCGFNMATDRVYTPGAGTNHRDAEVDVLSAVVVSTEPGSGTFVASFVNNYPDDPASVTGIGGDVATDEEVSIEISPHGIVNLADEDAPDVEVTGEFQAGDFVSVQVQFGDGDFAQLQVPVVDNAGYYAGLDGPAPEDAGPSFDGPGGHEEGASEGAEPAEGGH